MQEKKVHELTIQLKRSFSKRTQVRTHFTKQRLNEPNVKGYGQEHSIDFLWRKFSLKMSSWKGHGSSVTELVLPIPPQISYTFL